jgi:4-hydroxyacetophenone monooxygenase
MLERGVSSVEVRQDVHDDYNRHLDERLQQMVWSLPSADTWCRNKHGRVTANMPWSSLEYWQLVRHPDLNHYNVTKA